MDTNVDAARALVCEAGNPPTFADLEQLFAAAPPQLIHVLTPPRAHAAPSLVAIQLGAHVLLEKPATTSVEDCDALLAAAEAADLTVGVDETVA